jgi:phage tail-like protein
VADAIFNPKEYSILKKEEGGRHTPFQNKSRPQLKSFFETGDIPTQEQFATMIDSMVNRHDDRYLLGLRDSGSGMPTGRVCPTDGSSWLPVSAREAGSGMATGRRGCTYAMYSVQKACRTSRDSGSGMPTGRKSISVIFHNDAGEEAGRYNFFEAWPCRWKAPSLNARNSGHATEAIEIVFERIEMK